MSDRIPTLAEGAQSKTDKFFNKVFRPFITWMMLFIFLGVLFVQFVDSESVPDVISGMFTKDVFFYFLPTFIAVIMSLQIIGWFFKKDREKIIKSLLLPLAVFVIALIFKNYLVAITLYSLLLMFTSRRYVIAFKFSFG